MNNVNVNLSIGLTINVDGQKVGGFSGGIPLFAALAAAGAMGNVVSEQGSDEPAPTDRPYDGPVTEASLGAAAAGEAVAPATEAAPAAATPTAETLAKQDHSRALGSTGTNAEKLAWALDNRFVVEGDEELYEASDIDEDESDRVYRVVDRNAAGAVLFGNLYREAEGYAKLGSRTHSSAYAASAKGNRSSNFIDVVGLIPR